MEKETIEIRQVTENKKAYLELLLLADEQESMIDRYLDRGTMYVLEDDGVKAECVVTDEGNGILEIKNLVIYPESRRMGYGRALIEEVVRRYRDRYDVLQVGTGDSPLTIPFYESCGFCRSHVIKDFFVRCFEFDEVQTIGFVESQHVDSPVLLTLAFFWSTLILIKRNEHVITG